MAFHDMQFPVDISVGAVGGPAFNTDVVVLESGHESRNANWSVARGSWNVAHAIKLRSQLNTLIAFFRARQGKAHTFRFKDWTDYGGTAQATSPATGNGSTTAFQLQKSYVSGSQTVTRTITKPVNNGTLKIYLNAVLQVSGYTVDYSTGIVTFSIAPGAGVAVTADFEFDVPVRFDTDKLPATVDAPEVFSWGEILLVEVRT